MALFQSKSIDSTTVTLPPADYIESCRNRNLVVEGSGFASGIVGGGTFGEIGRALLAGAGLNLASLRGRLAERRAATAKAGRKAGKVNPTISSELPVIPVDCDLLADLAFVLGAKY